MTELFHITQQAAWQEALPARQYRMSTRNVSLEEQGFIHCSLRHQLRAVAQHIYGDADNLVVLVTWKPSPGASTRPTGSSTAIT